MAREEPWPMLPEPQRPPPGGDLRNNRKGKFSVGQKFDLDAQLREVQIIRLRSEGKSYAEIAEILGYTDPNTVSAAYKRATRKYIAPKAQEYARVILQQHVDDIGKIDEVIASPGYKTDVKGSLVSGPDGEWLEDENVRVQALTERRKTLESMRRMIGTDAPRKTELDVKMSDELNEQIKVTLERYQELTAGRAPVVQLPEDDIFEADVIEPEDHTSHLPGTPGVPGPGPQQDDDQQAEDPPQEPTPGTAGQ